MIVLFIFTLLSSAFGRDLYVSTTGSDANSGLTQSATWTLAKAFRDAVAGDTVHIRAGQYDPPGSQQVNSGTEANLIRFVGYKSVPGDIDGVAAVGSSFKRTDKNTNPNPADMPLVRGAKDNEGMNLQFRGNWISVENLYSVHAKQGIFTHGDHMRLVNVITADNGLQADNSDQGGRGFQIYGSHNLVLNCFSLNSNAEAFNFKGGSFNQMRDSVVWSDNLVNMGGYYIALTFGAHHNLIEGCTLYRDPTGDLNLPHQGHGYILKDRATDNIIRNCTAYNTGIEVNFSGVFNNLFENVEIYGLYSQYNTQFSSCISMKNGAHDNVFRNIYIEDTRYPYLYQDFDDGFAAADGDRDEDHGSSNNIFVNNVVNRYNTLVNYATISPGQSESLNNKWYNCVFYNGESVLFPGKQIATGQEFHNCIFDTNPTTYRFQHTVGVFEAKFFNCNWGNMGTSAPSGQSITTLASMFKGPFPAKDASSFQLQSGSPLRGKGTVPVGVRPLASVDQDFNNAGRPQAGWDVGAFQFGATPANPVTSAPSPLSPPPPVSPPSVQPGAGPVLVSAEAVDVTSNSFHALFTLDRRSRASVEYGLTTAYGMQTAGEQSFVYATHKQPVTGLQPATLYHWRVIDMEDEQGRVSPPGPDQVVITLTSSGEKVTITPAPVPATVNEQGDTRAPVPTTVNEQGDTLAPVPATVNEQVRATNDPVNTEPGLNSTTTWLLVIGAVVLVSVCGFAVCFLFTLGRQRRNRSSVGKTRAGKEMGPPRSSGSSDGDGKLAGRRSRSRSRYGSKRSSRSAGNYSRSAAGNQGHTYFSPVAAADATYLAVPPLQPKPPLTYVTLSPEN